MHQFVINALIFLMREKCSFFAGIYKVSSWGAPTTQAKCIKIGLFQEFVFTGSVKDGLKIESPNEFDLNFIFDLQLLGAFIQVIKDKRPWIEYDGL